MRVNKCVIADADARHNPDLDTGAAIIADECPQFIPAGIHGRVTDFDFDVLRIEAPVGRNRAGAEGTTSPDDRITGIAHVKLGGVPDIGFFNLRAETHHAFRADVTVCPDQRVIADNGVTPKINRTADNRIFQNTNALFNDNLAVKDGCGEIRRSGETRGSARSR